MMTMKNGKIRKIIYINTERQKLFEIVMPFQSFICIPKITETQLLFTRRRYMNINFFHSFVVQWQNCCWEAFKCEKFQIKYLIGHCWHERVDTKWTHEVVSTSTVKFNSWATVWIKKRRQKIPIIEFHSSFTHNFISLFSKLPFSRSKYIKLIEFISLNKSLLCVV